MGKSKLIDVRRGQDQVEKEIGRLAREFKVTVDDLVWWPYVGYTTEYDFEVSRGGMTVYQRFTMAQLMHWQDDNKMKVQVSNKIAGMIGKLAEPTPNMCDF